MIDLNKYKSQLIEICRKLSVERLDIVGSAARNDFDPKASDIDVLIQFEGRENLFHRYFDLKFELEELFGRKVDVIQESAIENPYIYESLKNDRIEIYAA